MECQKSIRWQSLRSGPKSVFWTRRQYLYPGAEDLRGISRRKGRTIMPTIPEEDHLVVVHSQHRARNLRLRPNSEIIILELAEPRIIEPDLEKLPDV